MPLIDDSLSNYVSPNYNLDVFPVRRNGRTISSYVRASIFNGLASSIIATEKRFKVINAAFSATYDVTGRIYFAPSGSFTNASGGWKPAGDYSSNSGFQIGITGSVAPTLAATGAACELFWGIKQIKSGSESKIGICRYDARFDPGINEGPCLVANWWNGQTWLATHSYQANIAADTYQDLNLSSSGRPLRLGASGLLYTPGKALGAWFSHNAEYNKSVKRVIIGSSRMTAVGRQTLKNSEVYRPPSGSSGFPGGFNVDGKDILGPGALLTTATFFIPQVTLTASRRRSRFLAYPNMNSSYRESEPSPGFMYAHVIVLGL